MGSLIPLFLVASHYSISGPGASSIPAALVWSCLAWSAVIANSRLYMGVSTYARPIRWIQREAAVCFQSSPVPVAK